MKITEGQDQSPVVKPSRQSAILVLVGGLLWVLLAGPAWLVAGQEGLAGLSVSAALCLFSGIPIILLIGPFANSKPMLPMFGSVVRLMIVFCGCLAVVEIMPTWGFQEVFIWLVIYYIVLLAVETAFVLQCLKPSKVSDNPDTSVSS